MQDNECQSILFNVNMIVSNKNVSDQHVITIHPVYNKKTLPSIAGGSRGTKKPIILRNQRHNLTIYTPSMHFKSYRYIYRSFMASQGSIKPRLFYGKLALP